MPTLEEYMARYDHEHTSVGNRVMHGIGIPLIFIGIILLVLTHWKAGLAFFVAGWLLLLIGHRIEGNKPAFFQGAIYFLVGPLWVGREIKGYLLGRGSRTAARQSTASKLH